MCCAAHPWGRVLSTRLSRLRAGEFGGLPGMDAIEVVKAAYVTHASEALGIGAEASSPDALQPGSRSWADSIAFRPD